MSHVLKIPEKVQTFIKKTSLESIIHPCHRDTHDSYQ